MSQLFVDNIKNRTGGAIGAPSGIVVTGVVTATSLSGNASGLSGIDATALKDSGGNIKVQANTSGIVVTGASTFSSNVSVGGVLTYDDVTNVDSVGLITARSGIRIGAGQSVSAVSGIATYYGDGSQLTGIELGTQNFVASGTIANGQTVVINADGTVGIATLSTTGGTVGSVGVFESAATFYCASTYDTNTNKVVIAYVDQTNSNYGTAVVGTVSGTSISFGTPVVFESDDCSFSLYNGCVFKDNKIVIAYTDSGDSNKGKAIVGTVSGTSISFGSPSTFRNGTTYFVTAAPTNESNKVVISFKSAAESSYGKATVGTIVGNNISFSSNHTFHSAATNYPRIILHAATGKLVISYVNDTNNDNVAIVGTVSGTSISFGSPTVYKSSNNASKFAIAYDSTNEKVVIVYGDAGDNGRGTATVGTISGTSISFGTAVAATSNGVANMSASYEPTTGKVVIFYRDNGNSNKLTAVYGTISGTSISFSSEFVVNNITADDLTSVYDPDNGKLVITYRDTDDNNYGKSGVYTMVSEVTNLTAENYIGIAAEAISNGATGKVNILGGVNTGQTGLTTAKTYYVQPTGTLATSAGSPSVVAGTSISDTKILIRQ